MYDLLCALCRLPSGLMRVRVLSSSSDCLQCPTGGSHCGGQDKALRSGNPTVSLTRTDTVAQGTHSVGYKATILHNEMDLCKSKILNLKGKKMEKYICGTLT